VLIVCVVAYVLSGHASIYPAQRLFRTDDIARPE
jgi:ABC-type lipoprotein release transport system permease subunit